MTSRNQANKVTSATLANPKLQAVVTEGDGVSITFEAVTKRFADGTVAVDALDLQVPAAQTVVLVGPSGCGKTTTLRMINRLVEPTAGRILLDGQDVTTASPARLRRGIGYVIQQAGLFPHRTVRTTSPRSRC